ncbi:MAG TPA: M28 family peptidase, partial [Sediminibacterium sp.]
MRKLLLLCLPFAASVAMAQDDPQLKYAELISPKALREKLTILAGPEMEGRETGFPGQKKAAAYIEEQFKKMGLKPGNGDSYQQTFPVYFDAMTNPVLRVNGKTFGWDKEYMFAVNSMFNGRKTFTNSVFAGYGNKEDYEGLDVKGKVVIVLDGGTQPAPAAGGRPARGFNATVGKMTAARDHGAAGLLLISSAFPRTNATPMKSGRMTLQVSDPTFFFATISDEVASALIGRTAKVPFADWNEVHKGNYTAELVLGADKKPEELQSSNVIGVLPGTDKADEFVFVTGHYDHLGKRGNVIYYGADDDGSGTVGAMQIAEAF